MRTQPTERPDVTTLDAVKLSGLFLDTEGVASMLGISSRTVFRMVRLGRFPPPRLRIGRTVVRWSVVDVRAWLASLGVEVGRDLSTGELITRKRAAELLGVHKRTIARMVDRGELDEVRFGPTDEGMVHYRLSQLRAIAGEQ